MRSLIVYVILAAAVLSLVAGSIVWSG